MKYHCDIKSMNNSFILFIVVIITNIVTNLVVFITATSKISDNRKKKLSWLNRKGWVVVICIITSIILSAVQYWINDNDAKDKEFESLQSQRIKDSLTLVENDIRSEKIIKTFSESLAKYGLKYDSTQKVIEKLVKDSSNVTIVNANEPDFDFCIEDSKKEPGIKFIRQTSDSYVFLVSFCSLTASSNNINVGLRVAYKNIYGNTKLIPGAPLEVIANNSKLNLNGISSMELNVPINEEAEVVYFYLEGTYSNISNSKTIKLQTLRSYDILNMKYTIPYESGYSEILKLFTNLRR